MILNISRLITDEISVYRGLLLASKLSGRVHVRLVGSFVSSSSNHKFLRAIMKFHNKHTEIDDSASKYW